MYPRDEQHGDLSNRKSYTISQTGKKLRSYAIKGVKKWITQVIEENKGMWVLRGNLAEGKQEILKVKDENEETTSNEREILANIRDFYASLYRDNGEL